MIICDCRETEMWSWSVSTHLLTSSISPQRGGLQQRQGANWTHYVTHYCREVFSTDPLHWCCCTTTLFCSGNESSCKKQPQWQRKAGTLSFLTQVTLKRPPFVSIRVVCSVCLSVCMYDWLTDWLTDSPVSYYNNLWELSSLCIYLLI
jgi:hypothetical protein